MFECDCNTIPTYDRCLSCSYLGNGCSGPRTSAMPYMRWLEWIKDLRQLRKSQGWKVSNNDISEACDLAKNTVDNIFAGKNKDVSRTTAGLIEDYLIGGSVRWPCPMDLNIEKDVVYQDRPETLVALEIKSGEVISMQKALDDIHASYQKELEAVREDAERKIAYLLKENDQKDRVIDKLLK